MDDDDKDFNLSRPSVITIIIVVIIIVGICGLAKTAPEFLKSIIN